MSFNQLAELYEYIDACNAAHLQELSSFMDIRSTFCNQSEIGVALQRVICKLNSLGFIVEELKNLESNQSVLFAQSSCNGEIDQEQRNTLLIYGHVDVLPVEQNEQWLFEPFSLQQHEGMLYGRGICSGKGQLYCWLQAIEAWLMKAGRLPVNVKFVIQSMHECHSNGLDTHLAHQREFLSNVDYMAVFVNSWLSAETCLVHTQLAGWLQFNLQLKPPETRRVRFESESLTDLCQLMSMLTDSQSGKLNIPHIERFTRNTTLRDRYLLSEVDCSMQHLQRQLELNHTPTEHEKAYLLQQHWCKPNLIIHKISSATDQQPECANCSFSIKLMPGQPLTYVKELIVRQLKANTEQLEMLSQLHLTITDYKRPVSYKSKSTHISALCRSLRGIYPSKNIDVPDAICLDMPVVHMLRAYCPCRVIFVPYTKISFQCNQQNEHLPLQQFTLNIKLAVTLLHEMNQLPTRCKAHTHGAGQ